MGDLEPLDTFPKEPRCIDCGGASSRSRSLALPTDVGRAVGPERGLVRGEVDTADFIAHLAQSSFLCPCRDLDAIFINIDIRGWPPSSPCAGPFRSLVVAVEVPGTEEVP